MSKHIGAQALYRRTATRGQQPGERVSTDSRCASTPDRALCGPTATQAGGEHVSRGPHASLGITNSLQMTFGGL